MTKSVQPHLNSKRPDWLMIIIQGNSYEAYTDGGYHYDNTNGSTYDSYADGSS